MKKEARKVKVSELIPYENIPRVNKLAIEAVAQSITQCGYMINSLISSARKAGLPWHNITGCRKNEIADRPKTVDMLLNTGRMKISKRCPEVIKAIQSLRWDEKNPSIPEDKNIGNCNDWWDALNYTMLDFIEYIDLDR